MKKTKLLLTIILFIALNARLYGQYFIKYDNAIGIHNTTLYPIYVTSRIDNYKSINYSSGAYIGYKFKKNIYILTGYKISTHNTVFQFDISPFNRFSPITVHKYVNRHIPLYIGYKMNNKSSKKKQKFSFFNELGINYTHNGYVNLTSNNEQQNFIEGKDFNYLEKFRLIDEFNDQ